MRNPHHLHRVQQPLERLPERWQALKAQLAPQQPQEGRLAGRRLQPVAHLHLLLGQGQHERLRLQQPALKVGRVQL